MMRILVVIALFMIGRAATLVLFTPDPIGVRLKP